MNATAGMGTPQQERATCKEPLGLKQEASCVPASCCPGTAGKCPGIALVGLLEPGPWFLFYKYLSLSSVHQEHSYGH